MRKITDAGTYRIEGLNVPIAFRGRSDRHNANRRANTTRYSDRSKGTGMEDLYEIMYKYHIKGFEFGNWVTQEQRAEYVAALGTTLEELYSVIGSRNLGFDRNVGIAFGARGARGAIAHYEPVCNMINLTREHGAGSLAHEYGHAIDYNFGGFVDQHKKHTSLSGGRSTAAILPDNVGGILRHLVNQIVDSIRNGKNFAKMEEINKEQMAIDGKVVFSEYFFRRTEIFARFFEQYVSYCLYERGISNRLLAKSWATYASGVVYVQKDDFLKIKPVADKLMKELVEIMNAPRRVKARSAAYPKPVIAKPKSEPKKIEAPKMPKNTTSKAASFKKPEIDLDVSALKKYDELKKQYPGVILLFRDGDFYFCYKNDAIEVAKILIIPLEHKGGADGIPSAGFPSNLLNTYLPKLVRAGKRVAICDPLNPSQPKKGTPAKTIDKSEVLTHANKLGVIEGHGQSVRFTAKLKDLVSLYSGHKQEVLNIVCEKWADDTIRRRGGGRIEHYKEEALKEARRILAKRK